MKKIIFGLVVLTSFSFASNSQAQSKPSADKSNQMDQKYGKDREMAIEKLKLTDAQKDQMKTINENFRAKMEELNKTEGLSVEEKRLRKKALLDNRKEEFMEILTPEQKEEASTMIEEHQKAVSQKEMKLEEMKAQLSLTDEQVGKIKETQAGFEEKSLDIRTNSKLTEDQKREKLDILVKAKHEKLLKILTPDQAKKLQEIQSN